MSRATWIAIVCALSARAVASPRTDPTSGRAVFTGAVSPNPTSIDVNPAALGLGIHSEAYVAAVGTLDQYSIDLATEDAVDTTTVPPGSPDAVVWPRGPEGGRHPGIQTLHLPPGPRALGQYPLRSYPKRGDFCLGVKPVGERGIGPSRA